MNAWKSRALALAAAALAGCAAMPNIQPVETTAAELTGIGDPFEFRTQREAVDVADGVGTTDPLSLDLALRLALRHDPGVQAALARVRQAEAEARQTRLLPNPVLAIAVRFPESGGGRPDIEASVAADLLSLLLKPGRISAADGRLRKSTAEALVVVLDAIAEVQQQYAKAQSLAAQVAIDEQRRTTLSDLVKVTEARFKGGEAARLDVLTVQSEQASLETELLSRRSEEQQARLTLARLVGQPSSSAKWRLDLWTEPSSIADDEGAWLGVARQRRPEIRAIEWELAALGDDLRVARFAAFDGAAVGVDAERDGDWSVGPGASLPIPLFDVGQAQRELVRARIIEQRHELTRAERLVVQEVRIALEQFRSTRAVLVEVERRLLPLQDQRLIQARNSYRLGVADVLAVRIAEQDLQRARSQQVELQAQVSQATSQLMRAVGGMTLVASTTRPTTQNTTE